jgi:hypothetical protein
MSTWFKSGMNSDTITSGLFQYDFTNMLTRCKPVKIQDSKYVVYFTSWIMSTSCVKDFIKYPTQCKLNPSTATSPNGVSGLQISKTARLQRRGLRVICF